MVPYCWCFGHYDLHWFQVAPIPEDPYLYNLQEFDYYLDCLWRSTLVWRQRYADDAYFIRIDGNLG